MANEIITLNLDSDIGPELPPDEPACIYLNLDGDVEPVKPPPVNPEPPVVTMYVDGACHGNPGPGAWAAVLACNGQTKEISGYLPTQPITKRSCGQSCTPSKRSSDPAQFIYIRTVNTSSGFSRGVGNGEPITRSSNASSKPWRRTRSTGIPSEPTPVIQGMNGLTL